MNWTEVVAAVLSTGFVYGLTLARTWVQAHTTPAQYSTLAGMARSVVDGIDQLDQGEKLGNDNRYKLALSTMQSMAKRVGLKLTDDELSAFIHAALRASRQEAALFTATP